MKYCYIFQGMKPKIGARIKFVDSKYMIFGSIIPHHDIIRDRPLLMAGRGLGEFTEK